MVHARVIRPSGVGATLVHVDDSAAKQIPGLSADGGEGQFRRRHRGRTNGRAIQAAKAVKVTWSAAEAILPRANRSVQAHAHRRAESQQGDAEAGRRGSGASPAPPRKSKRATNFRFSRTPPWAPAAPSRTFTSMALPPCGPAARSRTICRRASRSCCTSTIDKVRVIWVEDAGSYGRPGFEDAAADAVILSQAVGKPVRVQWMREDMHAWGSKGPAVLCDMSAGLERERRSDRA